MSFAMPHRLALSITIGLMFIQISISGADAAAINQLVLSDGTEIVYVLALPSDFRRERSNPVLMIFPGGEQTIDTVQNGLERFWEAEALRHGFIVISPAAPRGRPFIKDGIELVPKFLNRLQKRYRVKGNKSHLPGHSDGGVSAFRAAVRYPELFSSLTVLAGFPEEGKDFARLDSLKNIKISMFVGDGDLYWKEGMKRTFDRLKFLKNEVYFEILPRNGHFLPGLSFENSSRIFDHIQP